MTKYFVSGCIDADGETTRVSDSEAQFWTVYEREDNGTSQAVGDCDSRESAEAFASLLNSLTMRADALAAENVAMRQIIDSVTNLDNEPQYHAEGMGCGLEDRNITDRYDAMRHGWDEAMERVYAEVIPCAEELDFLATDDYLESVRNEARAQGIHFAANRILAAWEAGFINDTPAHAYDISGAVLSALEFLPNASAEEFKRDYADEVRTAIAARLRNGETE
ncbi:hypothetical protein PMPD1_3132 [Paramixta manurensis]|uniref:Ead/Ea22-like family protein n=1 Tax=Paramixta manurensis TaxID=2740817 RepID=A0A6M8UMC4_9GAMM|nr:hypothetical protein PMPD1_3132 [Erwiniaceae bacterium PD-1]